MVSDAHSNKKIVQGFMDDFGNGMDPGELWDKYCGPEYIQHNPRLVNGKAGFLEFVRNAGLCAGFTFNVKKIAADDDLVWLLSESTGFHWSDEPDPVDPSSLRHAFIDIWRIKDGRMVEHWDFYQKIPSYSANGNDMI